MIVIWHIYPPFPFPLSQPGISQQIWVMTAENCSVATNFTFPGRSDRRHVQQGLFVLFLLVYGITVVANVGMVLLIKRDPSLHTPMYYFLSNLSFCNICYSSTISPKMLADFLSEQKKDSIWCMCHPDVLLWSLWRCGMSHVGCHGLGPLCGHLQSTSLYNCHVQGNLYPACGYCLHRRLGWFSNPYLLYISVVILQFQYHQSLFLWHSTLISPFLLRYVHQWDNAGHIQ